MWPPSCATSLRTATASLVTSGPMPSPAVTRIFRCIRRFSSGAKAQSHFGAFSARLKSCPDTKLKLEAARLRSLIQFRDGHVAAFADLVGQQADQILVVDVFLAVGQGYKAVVGVLQLFAGEGEAELLKPVAQRRAAGVLAEDQMRLGDADQGGVMIS